MHLGRRQVMQLRRCQVMQLRRGTVSEIVHPSDPLSWGRLSEDVLPLWANWAQWAGYGPGFSGLGTSGRADAVARLDQ